MQGGSVISFDGRLEFVFGLTEKSVMGCENEMSEDLVRRSLSLSEALNSMMYDNSQCATIVSNYG